MLLRGCVEQHPGPRHPDSDDDARDDPLPCYGVDSDGEMIDDAYIANHLDMQHEDADEDMEDLPPIEEASYANFGLAEATHALTRVYRGDRTDFAYIDRIELMCQTVEAKLQHRASASARNFIATLPVLDTLIWIARNATTLRRHPHIAEDLVEFLHTWEIEEFFSLEAANAYIENVAALIERKPSPWASWKCAFWGFAFINPPPLSPDPDADPALALTQLASDFADLRLDLHNAQQPTPKKRRGGRRGRKTL